MSEKYCRTDPFWSEGQKASGLQHLLLLFNCYQPLSQKLLPGDQKRFLNSCSLVGCPPTN